MTAASVATSRRSTSSSVWAYEKWLRLRFSGSSKIAVLHHLAAVADEEIDVVPEQVVVAHDRAFEEVGHEDRAEAGDDGRDAEAVVERL